MGTEFQFEKMEEFRRWMEGTAVLTVAKSG
jgi:hypothetical protein